ncbi:CBS domain-containing protein [Halomicrobium sp. IBSBa]|uniref:CBS domain-containing protein n=1 Tax=Halomicrobium sp. IBSBa TaxID=2778916 RepID=UPI001ABF0DFE|nr:CBS domain-containing protein [Halomicrobium sp. IBSBa]MBO4247977.1 CBS domain-containing protein [Halomicrobium sp. IBSBa]
MSADTVLVEDVMSTPLETTSPNATVRAVAEQMREANVNGLFVPGADAGIVTTTDVVHAVAEGADLSETRVADVMTSPVERVETTTELNEAAAMMTNFGIKHLPVMDDHGDYVGMVSSTDTTGEFA